MSSFKVLAAALESGYLTLVEIHKWVDGYIEKDTDPDSWLLEVSVSKSAEEARKILFSNIDPGLENESQYSELLIGFYFLVYSTGSIELTEFLTLAGDIADAHDMVIIECETVYGLLNRAEKGDEGVTAEVERLFSRIGQKAEKCYRVCMSQTGAD